MRSSLEMLRLEGQRAVVTGAGSGIGQAIALRLAEAGADLTLLDVNPTGLEETQGKIAGLPGNSTARTIDLAEKAEIDAFWVEEGSRSAILVNNAGLYPMQDFLQVEKSEWDRTLQINLESMVWMCQGFIRHRNRKEAGGKIVNISSVEAVLPFADGLIPYTVSKSGVIALTRGIARDYGRQGFRANVILPGGIKTAGTRGAIKQAIRTFDLGLAATGYDFQRRLAVGRWGEADEVARVVLFLASELASYVQGAVIPVDGGFLSS